MHKNNSGGAGKRHRHRHDGEFYEIDNHLEMYVIQILSAVKISIVVSIARNPLCSGWFFGPDIGVIPLKPDMVPRYLN